MLLNKALARMLKAVISHGLDPKEIYPSISMRGKSRKAREVLQHYHVMSFADIYTIRYLIAKLSNIIYMNLNEIDTLKFSKKILLRFLFWSFRFWLFEFV